MAMKLLSLTVFELSEAEPTTASLQHEFYNVGRLWYGDTELKQNLAFESRIVVERAMQQLLSVPVLKDTVVCHAAIHLSRPGPGAIGLVAVTSSDYPKRVVFSLLREAWAELEASQRLAVKSTAWKPFSRSFARPMRWTSCWRWRRSWMRSWALCRRAWTRSCAAARQSVPS